MVIICALYISLYSRRSAKILSSQLVGTGALGPVCLAVLLVDTINSSKVLEFRCRICPDRFPTFLPIRRTHFTMLILASHRILSAPIRAVHCRNPTHSKLERLHETQRLVDRTSDGQIVHGDLPQHALGIDQVARTERDPLILNQTSVVARDAQITVR